MESSSLQFLPSLGDFGKQTIKLIWELKQIFSYDWVQLWQTCTYTPARRDVNANVTSFADGMGRFWKPPLGHHSPLSALAMSSREHRCHSTTSVSRRRWTSAENPPEMSRCWPLPPAPVRSQPCHGEWWLQILALLCPRLKMPPDPIEKWGKCGKENKSLTQRKVIFISICSWTQN